MADVAMTEQNSAPKATADAPAMDRNAPPPGNVVPNEQPPHYDELAYQWSAIDEAPLAPGGAGGRSSSSANLNVDAADAKAAGSASAHIDVKAAGSEGNAGDSSAPKKPVGPPGFVRAVSLMKPGFDTEAMNRIQKQIALWSGACLFINAMVIILGFAVVHREFGPFAASNIFTLVAFALGTFVFAQTGKHARMILAKCYFVFLYLLMFVGTPLAIYYTATVSQRVDEFCKRDDQTCSDSKRSSLVDWGIALGVLGTVLWYCVFSFFSRHVFVYCVATERAHLAEDPGVLPRWLVFLSRTLPNWHAFWRWVNARARTCGDCTASCDDACDNSCSRHTCECDDCCPSNWRDKMGTICVAFCCCGCVVLLIVALTLCFTLKAGKARAIWCIIAEIILIFFQAAASSSSSSSSD